MLSTRELSGRQRKPLGFCRFLKVMHKRPHNLICHCSSPFEDVPATSSDPRAEVCHSRARQTLRAIHPIWSGQLCPWQTSVERPSFAPIAAEPLTFFSMCCLLPIMQLTALVQEAERGRAESSCISLLALLGKHFEPWPPWPTVRWVWEILALPWPPTQDCVVFPCFSSCGAQATLDQSWISFMMFLWLDKW